MNTEPTHTLYRAALAADRRLSDALHVKFGADAGDRRYMVDTYRENDELRRLRDEYIDACQAYFAVSPHQVQANS